MTSRPFTPGIVASNPMPILMAIRLVLPAPVLLPLKPRRLNVADGSYANSACSRISTLPRSAFETGQARIDGTASRLSRSEVPVGVPEAGLGSALAYARARTRFFATTTEVETSMMLRAARSQRAVRSGPYA